jgi:hypothetical protein
MNPALPKKHHGSALGHLKIRFKNTFMKGRAG